MSAIAFLAVINHHCSTRSVYLPSADLVFLPFLFFQTSFPRSGFFNGPLQDPSPLLHYLTLVLETRLPRPNPSFFMLHSSRRVPPPSRQSPPHPNFFLEFSRPGFYIYYLFSIFPVPSGSFAPAFYPPSPRPLGPAAITLPQFDSLFAIKRPYPCNYILFLFPFIHWVPLLRCTPTCSFLLSNVKICARWSSRKFSPYRLVSVRDYSFPGSFGRQGFVAAPPPPFSFKTRWRLRAFRLACDVTSFDFSFFYTFSDQSTPSSLFTRSVVGIPPHRNVGQQPRLLALLGLGFPPHPLLSANTNWLGSLCDGLPGLVVESEVRRGFIFLWRLWLRFFLPSHSPADVVVSHIEGGAR